ncbi:MAG: N-acetylmuramate alpha-1-phosphate uridylyltransferase MurU [Gammaproteobacteria bacterium]
MKAMIMAAGRGERLRPLTDTTPKPLLEVKGKPLIVHHLERLHAAGFTDVVINVAWLADKIKNFLGDGSRYGIHILYSEESEGALETGGGILKALPLLGSEAFLVVNGDIYTDFSFDTLKFVLKDKDLAHLVMVPNPASYPQGDFLLDADGRLRADGTPRLTYSGIGVHHPDFFRDCSAGKFPMLPWWQKAMEMDRMSGQLYSGLWKDIGTPESLRAASQFNSDS